MSMSIDPKAVEVADDWIHEHIPLHDIMRYWKDSLGEAIEAYAQERVAELEAQNAALQAQVGEWQGVTTEKPAPGQSLWMATRKRPNGDLLDEKEWQVRVMRRGTDGNPNHFYDGACSVWLQDYEIMYQESPQPPLPDESPTAAESEE